MAIRARIAALQAWIVAPSKTFNLFGDYLKAVYERWNDYLWNALIIAPIVLWWMLGNPPMWVVVSAFVWALLVAGYFAWREEHLKNVSDDFRCWIYFMTCGREETDMPLLFFVGLRLSNVGPPTSIHTWQGGYNIDGKGMMFTDHFFRRKPVTTVPDGLRGSNLMGDMRLWAQGETREGWVAFTVTQEYLPDVVLQIMRTIHLEFTDSFGHLHPVSQLPMWSGNKQ